jgi:hypothetical protein
LATAVGDVDSFALLGVDSVCWRLMLPCDVGYTQRFALLAIPEPKTRFTVARHQSAKLDIPDLLEVAELAFAHLRRDESLWSMSAQTFRTRFRQVLQRLDVSTTLPGMTKTCDPGSLRAGGAMWLLQATENGELVRRRGRWMNTRVMDIYVQEIGAQQYMMFLSPGQRNRILALAECFPAVLRFSQQCCSLGLPSKTWSKMWTAEVVRKVG